MIDFPKLFSSNVEGLSDEQIKVASELAQTALNQRVAEIHRQFDQDITTATGNAKPAGVKTYEWMKQEFAMMKTAAETAAQKATEAAQEQIKELEARIEKSKKDGSDSAQVAQLQKELQDAKDLAEGLKSQHEQQLTELQGKYDQLNTDYRRAEVKQELAGMKFREDIPEDLRELAISSAVDHVLSMTKETDTEGQTVFRNADGKLELNPENGLAPFTASELLQSKLTGVLDKGRQQTGAGTKTTTTVANKDGVIVVNASTKKEAMEQIVSSLHAMGIPQGHENHQPLIDKAWEANNIASLPDQ